jgi:type III pantothenate kinase
MKCIAIDVGNTHTRIAVMEEQKVLSLVSQPTGDVKLASDILQKFHDEFFMQTKMPVVICSVVSKVSEQISGIVSRLFDLDALVIGKKIPLPLSLDLKDKKTVGVDRVVSAVMAYERMGKAVAVASFGTAITIDCVNEEGVFLGGVILPGLNMSARALSEQTAQLPLVELKKPESVCGKTTEQAISAGIIFGAAGMLREIVERFATQLKQWPDLIVTGGDGERMLQHCDFIHAFVPDLLLMGIDLSLQKWLEDSGK